MILRVFVNYHWLTLFKPIPSCYGTNVIHPSELDDIYIHFNYVSYETILASEASNSKRK